MRTGREHYKPWMIAFVVGNAVGLLAVLVYWLVR